MDARLMAPDSLEIDAVVPQCLDNQYVSDEVMAAMLARGVDYSDAEIARRREADFRTEFVRSLLYSSQVVIQRAFFKNSDFLYRNYLPERPADLHAFARLIRDRAVVPFLFTEDSLHDDLEFDLRDEGDRATKALLEAVGDEVTCVRLHRDPHQNATAAAIMATRFGAELSRLESMSNQQRNAMAAELFADPRRLQQDGAWAAFDAAVDSLVDYANRAMRGLRRAEQPPLSRQQVYADNFALDGKGENVVLGRFRRPDAQAPFLLELKKYVDLVYNVNLPDHLHRYTFTPVHLPTRMALQDLPRTGYTHEQISALLTDDDALEPLRRTFLAHAQNAMSLPLLADLTMPDVVAIRQLPEWEGFRAAQAAILAEPLRCLDRIDEFQQAFDAFQRSMCRWYNARYGRPATEARYATFVSLGLSIGGKLLIVGSDLGPYEKLIAGGATNVAVNLIPRKVKGYAAKLMVGVYDIGRRRLDADRSYTIELMQSNAELMRDDVMELLRAVNRSTGDALPRAAAGLADQGCS